MSQLATGTRVETVKPEVESKDWDASARKLRKWGAIGHVIGRSNNGHGLCYEVEHEDKTTAWYEPRELVECDGNSYTPEQRTAMLAKMREVAATYYGNSAASGCHALIEFTGLMNEFIRVCEKAHEQGIQFPFSNTHSGMPLPFEPHNLAYLAEKLDCIYGPSLAEASNRKAFIDALFHGEFKLVPASPTHREAPLGL